MILSRWGKKYLKGERKRRNPEIVLDGYQTLGYSNNQLKVLPRQINYNNAMRFKTELCSYFDDYPSQKLSLDFSQVKEINSAGIAVLVFVYSLATKNSRKLKLKGLNKKVRKAIEVAKLEKLLEV